MEILLYIAVINCQIANCRHYNLLEGRGEVLPLADVDGPELVLEPQHLQHAGDEAGGRAEGVAVQHQGGHGDDDVRG